MTLLQGPKDPVLPTLYIVHWTWIGVTFFLKKHSFEYATAFSRDISTVPMVKNKECSFKELQEDIE